MDISQVILSDIVHYMKYAKYIPTLKRRELYSETVNRVMNMHLKKFKNNKDITNKIINVFNEYVHTKKVLPSMRSMQFAGKPIEVNPTRGFNCSYLPVDDYRAFSEIMFLLLSGVGVGFSVQRHHIEKLPTINKGVRFRRYLIGDSIEGWSDAIKTLMKSYFFGKPIPAFDYSEIRSKGARLITSGGRAPGPEPLRDAIHNITKILERKSPGSQLTSLETYDIVCFIADAVLAGGIRRSATIALYSWGDLEMDNAKTGNWWELNPQRGRSNNSTVALRSKITKETFMSFWERIAANKTGDPAIVFSNDKDYGYNPCFTADTLVTIKDKDSNKVSDVTIKSLVDMDASKLPLALSYNIDNKFIEYKQIDAAMLTRKNSTLIELEFEDGTIIKCTPDHKIWTDNRGYVKASELKDDDVIIKNNGNTNTLLKISNINNEDVYDITVLDNHNFFANGILVHNCVEASLRPFTFCNLTTINGSIVETQQDFNNMALAATLIGTLQASYTDFHYLRDVWKRNTEKDSLIGVSITGLANKIFDTIDFKQTAKLVVDENIKLSEMIGIKSAARTTLVKPEGTASIILGTSSGVHPWYNYHYIRRIRVGKDEAMFSYLNKYYPHLLEDDFFRPDKQSIISIPQKAPNNAILRTTEDLNSFLDRIIKINTEWITPGHNRGVNKHNASATVYLKDNEWGEFGEWLFNNKENFAALSFLPFDPKEYKQAPFEDIDESVYNEMFSKLHDFDLSNIIEEEDNTDLQGEIACGGGACEIT